MNKTKIYEEYLMDEKVEDVLVNYAVPPKAGERLKKLQEALYQTREESIRTFGSSILEGILLFGSFIRGKPEPNDIDIIPFFDFSKYTPEKDNFRDSVNRSNQVYNLIQMFGKRFLELGGNPRLERLSFTKGGYYCPQDYIDCTCDTVFSRDFAGLSKFWIDLTFLKLRCINPNSRFHPKVSHILGPKTLKEQFRRILTS